MTVSFSVERMSRPHRAVLQRPACALKIAAIVAEWAYVEDHLTFLASGTLGSQTHSEEGKLLVSTSWIAGAAMEALNSGYPRLQVIRKTLIRLLPEELVSRWEALEEQIYKVSAARNTIVDGVWGITDECPDGLILSKYDTEGLCYMERDFDGVLEQIISVKLLIQAFMNAVMAAKDEGTVKVVGHWCLDSRAKHNKELNDRLIYQ